MSVLKFIASAIAWIFAFVFCLLIVTGLTMAVVLMRGGFDSESEIIKDPERSVAVLSLEGEILGSKKFTEKLSEQVKNEKVKAIVLRVNSPGGSVGSSEEIFRSIKNADKKKPVVCSLADIAASGGLYAAMGCRKIISNSGTITGSIGVIMMMPKFKGIMERIGVGMNIIKSGKFKDAGSPFRDMKQDERGLLQSLVNTSYKKFVEIVAEARGLPMDKVKSFADGRVILGSQAKDLGLIDEIGGLEKAALIALEEAGVKDKEPELVWPEKKRGLRKLFEEMDESISPFLFFIRTQHARLLYEWI